MHNEGRGQWYALETGPRVLLALLFLSPPSLLFFPLGRAATRLPAEGNKSAAGPNAESTCRTGSLFTLLQTLVTVSVASALPLSLSLSLSLCLVSLGAPFYEFFSSIDPILADGSPIIARLKWSRCKVMEKEKVSDRIG